jgi:hypothetical protein
MNLQIFGKSPWIDPSQCLCLTEKLERASHSDCETGFSAVQDRRQQGYSDPVVLCICRFTINLAGSIIIKQVSELCSPVCDTLPSTIEGMCK